MEAHGDGIYKDILRNIHEGVYCVDTSRHITFWNRGAERITGYGEQEVRGSACSDNILVHVDGEGHQLCQCGCPILDVLNGSTEHTDHMVYLHHRDGHRVPVNVSVTGIRDEGGAVIGAIEIFREKTDDAPDPEYVEGLRRAALIDPLTGLPNRRFLEMKLLSALEEKARHGTDFGVLFMDLDHFKEINDRHGHDVGDRVLRMVASTLQNNVRSYNMVGRWGGEEFVGILNHMEPAWLYMVARKLAALVGSSFIRSGQERVGVTITIGAAMAAHGETAESMIRRADQAMYRGKSCGRNCVIVDGMAETEC